MVIPGELSPDVVTDMDRAALPGGPGVMFGSSSILLSELPCQGWPGTNSGMSKLFWEEAGAPLPPTEDWVIGRWFGDWLALPVEWDSFWLSRNWLAGLLMLDQPAALEELGVDQGLLSGASPPVQYKDRRLESCHYVAYNFSLHIQSTTQKQSIQHYYTLYNFVQKQKWSESKG